MLGAVLVAALAAAPVVDGVEARLPSGSRPELLEGVPGLIAVRKGQTLSLRAVRRSLERLMETGRFSDARAFADESGEGVTVIFELTPKQLVLELFAEGQQALREAEVLKATRLEVGDEVDLARTDEATEAVQAFYRRRGYYDAEVAIDAEEAEGGVNVVVRVKEGLPVRVKSVVVEGDPGLPLPVLLETMGVERDQVADLEAIGVGLSRVREVLVAGRRWRAKVGTPRVDRDGRLWLPIEAGPRFRLEFAGATAFADSALRSALGDVSQEPLDDAARERLAERLEGLYRFRGYTDVRVTAVERLTRDGREGVITFLVDEGPQVLVRELTFTGNRVIDDSELIAVLAQVTRAAVPDTGPEVHPLSDPLALEGKMKEPRWAFPPEPAAETIFVESVWRDALRTMAQRYRDRGYLGAQVSLTSLDRDGDAARAHITVVEGAQARLHSAKALQVPPDVELEGVLPPSGEVFSESVAERARGALRQALGRKGYLFNTVTAEWTVSQGGTSVDLLLRGQSGPKVTVGKVLVKGLQRTEESVVRRALQVHEGEPLDADALFESQRALAELGIFRSADIRLLAPELAETVKDVVVDLKERPRLSGEFGLGYFLAEGPRVAVDAEYPNLAGRAVHVAARGRLNFFAASAPALARQIDVSDLQGFELFGGRGNLSVFNRGLLPFGIGTRLDLVGERVFRQSYRFTRLAAIPGLDWSTPLPLPHPEWARPKLTLQLQYELEWTRVFQVSNPSGATFPLTLLDQERLRFLFGTFALHTVRFAPTLDLRDDAVVPRKGVLVQAAAETTFDLFTRDQNDAQVPVQFLKVSGTVSGYVPLGNRFTLALSVRGGRIAPLANGSVTPPVKRFYLGGSSSMRGFREDGLLADDQRRDYDAQVTNCRALASSVGCTPAARTLLQGRELASQGGELFTLGKAELRFPAFGALDLGIFLEAGNLWLALPTDGFRLRTVAGSGLRYVTPVGPLALDVGVNLAPDALVNEPAFNLHFNIGLF